MLQLAVFLAHHGPPSCHIPESEYRATVLCTEPCGFAGVLCTSIGDCFKCFYFRHAIAWDDLPLCMTYVRAQPCLSSFRFSSAFGAVPDTTFRLAIDQQFSGREEQPQSRLNLQRRCEMSTTTVVTSASAFAFASHPSSSYILQQSSFPPRIMFLSFTSSTT